MADKDTLRGFDILADNLIGPTGGLQGVDNDDDDIPFVDPDDIKVDDKKSDKDDDNKDKEDIDSDDDLDDDVDDDIDDTDDVDDDKVDDDKVDDDTKDEPTKEELKKFENEVTKFFHEKFAEALGWDIDENTTIDTVDELVEYMEDVVAKASEPVYSNEEVKRIDEFVRDGGRVEDYYKAISTGVVDVDNVDITKESNQKLVIEEHLRNIGYSEDRIRRSLDRYEERGVLEEEAEDALELLKEYKEKNKQKLLENQEKFREDQVKQQQKFVNNVEETIDNLAEIAGYKLTPREKRELKDYIFKSTRDGRTQYQVEYIQNPELNLIESAFFTKNKDKLVDSVKRQASSKTLKDMQQKLKSSKGKRAKSSGRIDEGKGSVGLSDLGRQLLSK